MSLKKIIVGIFGLLLFIGLGIGGYFLVNKMGDVYQENTSSLESFGTAVIPISQSSSGDSVDVNGQNLAAPSIVEKNLSSSEKIIISLSGEKDALLNELRNARKQLKTLEIQVKELEAYKKQNQQLALKPLEEEHADAHNSLQTYLKESKDAERFDNFQKRAMALTGANAYIDILKQHQLTIRDGQKDKVVSDHLPSYIFCIGDSLGFVANNPREEQQVLIFLTTQNPDPLSTSLYEDIKTITSPCLKDLGKRVNKLLL